MQYDYEGKKLDPNFNKIINNVRSKPNNDFIETPRVIAAGMMLTKKVCQISGLFDPIYFCYHDTYSSSSHLQWRY